MKSESEKLFFRPTKIFAIVGIFIPGFSAIAIIGLQMLIALFGIKCANSWNILWIITTIAGLALPVTFFRYVLKTDADTRKIRAWLTWFNIFEYIFIQATLGMFFSDGRTLCYVSDGQNGIEFVFTAWFAIPILIGFTYWFMAILSKRNKFDQVS